MESKFLLAHIVVKCSEDLKGLLTSAVGCPPFFHGRCPSENVGRLQVMMRIVGEDKTFRAEVEKAMKAASTDRPVS